ncbi:MAG: OsmC family protein [Chloroflexi bacterium]|nr:OsmC family protein [Chloroflexota bacterium]
MGKEIKTAAVRWVEGLEFEAITGSEHRLTLDANVKAGGQNHGPSPMELLLVGLAGCTGMDIVDVLKKKRQEVTGLEVRVEGTRAETYPMVYTDIQVTYVVRGKNVSQKAVEDAIQLSETKYCSASAMLGKAARITSRYEVLPE